MLRPRPQGFPSGMQHEASQAASADTDPEDRLHRNLCCGTSSNEQVCTMAWPGQDFSQQSQ